MSKLDLEGKRFGKLTVLSFFGEDPKKNSHSKYLWNCQCDCGNTKIVTQHNLIYGSTQSCGCIRHGRILTGERFGKLLVLEEAEPRLRKDRKSVKKFWKCRCDCGNIIETSHELLVSGHSKSCGCSMGEASKIKFANYKSLRTENQRLYKIWCGMKVRCYTPTDLHYPNYGARGIIVCDEWKFSFAQFYLWAMTNGYNDTLTIDRIDVNGNYEPSNCRWITNRDQQYNKRTTKYYTIYGEKLLLHQIVEKYGIKPVTFYARINRYGFTPEQAVSIPIHCGGKYKRI